MPSLTASLIVRDAAPRLAGCLESIRAVVDQIVVLDTGSTDRTQELAAACGAEVREAPWPDDFAAARNQALAWARGAWVLSIDADERLQPTSRAALDAVLARPDTVGLTVLMHADPSYTPYRDLRLFRNAPDIRFEGIIHESVGASLQRRIAESGGRIAASGLAIDHLPVEDDGARQARDLPLLRRTLAGDPDQPYCWYRLGLIHEARHEVDEASAAWWAAVAAVRRVGLRRPSDSLAFARLVEGALDRGEDPAELLREASRRFPEDAALLWLTGRWHLAASRLDEAIAAFEHVRQWPRRNDFGLGYERRMFGAAADAALGICHFRGGRFELAERHFARAEAQEPDQPEHRLKRQLCRRLGTRALLASRSVQDGPCA